MMDTPLKPNDRPRPRAKRCGERRQGHIHLLLKLRPKPKLLTSEWPATSMHSAKSSMGG